MRSLSLLWTKAEKKAILDTMDIQSYSIENARSQVLEQVGGTMLRKGLEGAEDQASRLIETLGSAAPLAEGSGNRIDLSV